MRPYEENHPTLGVGIARTRPSAEVDEGLRAFMIGVYNNMVLSLAISALVALGVNKLALAGSEAAAVAHAGTIPLTTFGRLLYTTPLMWVVALAPIAFILVLSSRMDRMSPAAARSTLFGFAGVMGASLSTLLIRYTGASVVQVFFITAASFGAMSLWGYTTARSLSALGSFLMVGVIGLLSASLVNVFLGSGAVQFAISALGVLIFAGLTAYDTQKLKEIYLLGDFDADGAARASVFGALTLYLDFLNMFQFLLSLFGARNE